VTLGASAVPLAILVAFRVVLAVSQGLGVTTILLHPVTVAATVAAQVLAVGDWVTGRPLRWRERTLPAPSPRHDPEAAG
jgi:hypothetical protein